MKNKNHGVVVVNKATYLLLLTVPVGIIKIIYDAMECFQVSPPNLMQFIYDTFISLIIIVIGVSLFFKFNTRSAWMNPDHPSSQEDR